MLRAGAIPKRAGADPPAALARNQLWASQHRPPAARWITSATALLALLASGLLPASAHARDAHSTKHHQPAAKSPWSKPQIISPGDRSNFFGTSSGVAADGASLTVWTRRGVFARWRDAHGHLSRQQRISTAQQGKAAGGPYVAMAPDGTAVMLWTVDDGFHEVKHPGPEGDYARVRFRDGRLGPVHYISNTNYGNSGRGVFFGPTDNQPRIIWGQSSEPEHPQPEGLFAAPLDASSGLLAPLTLENLDNDPGEAGFGAIADDPALAVDQSGNALIVWVNRTRDQVVGRIMTRDGSLSPLLTISDPATRATPYPYLQASLSPSGLGHVVWATGEDLAGPVSVQARQIDISGNLGPIVPIARVNPLATPRAVAVASYADGRSLVTWASGRYGPVQGRIVGRDQADKTLLLSGSRRQEIQAHYPSVEAHGSQATVIWTYGQATPSTPRRMRYGRTVKYGLRSRSVSESGRLGQPVAIFPAKLGVFLRTSDLATNQAGRLVASWQANYSGGTGPRGVQVLVAGGR